MFKEAPAASGKENIMLMISLKNIEKKDQHLHAHSLLRSCLGVLGLEYVPGSTPVVLGEHGKPSLKDHPEIHYNLSHADGIAACMVSEHECGIDCEKVRAYRPNVVRRSFSENEQRLIDEAPGKERDLLFFRLWTLKEAYVKTIGIGVSYPLDTIEFSFDGENIISSAEGYVFRQHILSGGDYVVSSCEKI